MGVVNSLVGITITKNKRKNYMKITQTLQDVVNDHGMVDEKQLEILAREYPNLTIGIKFGCSSRIAVLAKDAKSEIDARMASNREEYVREAFLPSSLYDLIVQLLNPNMGNSPQSPDWENTIEAQLCRD